MDELKKLKQNKVRYLKIKITDEQNSILESKANSLGFNEKSSFVRFHLFIPDGLVEKIDQIHEKIVKDGNK